MAKIKLNISKTAKTFGPQKPKVFGNFNFYKYEVFNKQVFEHTENLRNSLYVKFQRNSTWQY